MATHMCTPLATGAFGGHLGHQGNDHHGAGRHGTTIKTKTCQSSTIYTFMSNLLSLPDDDRSLSEYLFVFVAFVFTFVFVFLSDLLLLSTTNSLANGGAPFCRLPW